MTEQNRQFDDFERQVSDRFRSDLRGLFEPTGSVPPQVDGAILQQARRRLARPRPIILWLRWAGGVAAAAAVITLGVFLYHRPASSNHPSTIINHQSAAAERRLDLDGNGRVDILDAFRLAKGIESRGPTAAEWDVNNDGRVDREDVDAMAAAAVRLRPVSVGCVPRTTTEQEEWCVISLLSQGEPAPSHSATRRGPDAVIPAKAGIHKPWWATRPRNWIPAPEQVEGRLCAGMTIEGLRDPLLHACEGSHVPAFPGFLDEGV